MYLAREFERRWNARVKFALTYLEAELERDVTWDELAEAMTEHTGREFTYNTVVNLAGRRSQSHRGRVRIDRMDDLVSTLGEVYGLCYARKDGSAGRAIDRAWFLSEAMATLTVDTVRGSSVHDGLALAA